MGVIRGMASVGIERGQCALIESQEKTTKNTKEILGLGGEAEAGNHRWTLMNTDGEIG